jgi:hypothetical protein
VNSGWQPLLQACLTAYVLDFVARQKQSSTHLNYFVLMQLPVPEPEVFDSIRAWGGNSDIGVWITGRVEALREYSSFDERLHQRCELDAAFFHLYGIEHEEVDYIMETFPIVKRKDIAEHGEYLTKRLILEIYDSMAEAERTGKPYQSPFDEQAAAAR